MNLFKVEGTVTALGQNVFDNNVMIYAYVVVTDASGRRTMIEKVAVCNDVGAVLELGINGRFYVDRLFNGNNVFRCQLWGVRADGLAVIDRHNLRLKTGLFKIVYGILTIPIFGIGLMLLFGGIRLLALNFQNDRQQMFKEGEGRLPPPLPTQAVRI
ncbi:hypothetical protein JQ600_09855 [Bradyrhizobium sp. AUGA SZCCT0176]|uniref:hypothetical protein n=1 Tax=Bradyrhizobium sp. AUGA SZCCT0176 TaxID=2807664 RepID=UPI001BA62C1F|nr:hypothetical protein [Bradyrhizobium sp. AUGA SZCCT0176]MBR1225221.1 hypothetical protein [Bradyrhizobium sp. AUGA SZCCT0176]